jgi:hypothetical protein
MTGPTGSLKQICITMICTVVIEKSEGGSEFLRLPRFGFKKSLKARLIYEINTSA